MTIETKVQIEVLKRLEKEKSLSWYAEDEKWIYITTNGYYGIRIPKDKFFLNCAFMKPMQVLASSFSSNQLSESHELTITDEMRNIGVGTGVILRCKQFDTCIRSKFLKKIFKKKCKLYSKDNKSSIYFVLDGEIYAVAMPIDISKKDKNYAEV